MSLYSAQILISNYVRETNLLWEKTASSDESNSPDSEKADDVYLTVYLGWYNCGF